MFNGAGKKNVQDNVHPDFSAVLYSVAPQLVTYWGLVPIPSYITSKKEQTNMLSKSEGYQTKYWFTEFRIM